MTIDDEIRTMLRARAARADSTGLHRAAVEAARVTPQLQPLRRGSRRGWPGPLRMVAVLAAVAVVIATVATVATLRDQTGRGGPSPLVAASPSSAASPSPIATPTDVPVTPQPYATGTCPVTPVTFYLGGVSPRILIGPTGWSLGTEPWQTGVGHQVILGGVTPGQVIQAEEVIAVRLEQWAPASPLPVTAIYPRAAGAPDRFVVGLPAPGCWLLTAVGPTVRSSIVVQAGPAPAGGPSPADPTVPAVTAPLAEPAACPVSPLKPDTQVRTWLDGDTQWEDPVQPANPASSAAAVPWTAATKRKLVVTGRVSESSAVELTVASRIGSPGGGASQGAVFVAGQPALATPAPGSGSKAFDITIPTAGCWALTYLTPTATTTIVVSVGRP